MVDKNPHPDAALAFAALAWAHQKLSDASARAVVDRRLARHFSIKNRVTRIGRSIKNSVTNLWSNILLIAYGKYFSMSSFQNTFIEWFRILKWVFWDRYKRLLLAPSMADRAMILLEPIWDNKANAAALAVLLAQVAKKFFLLRK